MRAASAMPRTSILFNALLLNASPPPPSSSAPSFAILQRRAPSKAGNPHRPSTTSSAALAMTMSTSIPASRSNAAARIISPPPPAAVVSSSTGIVPSSVVGILGGDYAGLHATFSSVCPGELVPVPERLVPPSMVEWGAIPPCLETLTSEDYWIAVVVGDENDDDENDNDGGGGGSSPLLTRTVVTVLPEVGCGIDNLEVTRRSEDLSSHVFRRLVGWRSSSAPPAARDDDEGCRGGGIRRTERRNQEVAVVDRGSGTTYEVETIFQVDDDTDEREEENDGDDDDYDGTTTTTTTTTTTMTRHRRIRVSLSLVIPERRTEEDRRGGGGIAIKPSNLIDLRVERRVSSRSTRGTAWTGPAHDSGGLDARTVSRTIGESITHGDVFATTKTKGNDVGRDPWTLFPVIPAGGTYEDGDGREKTTDLLGGAWMRTAIFPPPAGDDDDIGAGVLTTRTESDFAPGGTPSVVALRLPQNVMIRYGTGISSPDDGTTWSIEISHFGVATIGDDGGPTGVRRRVVLRSFDLTMSRNNTTEGKRCGSNNGLGNIHYWVEDKYL